MVGKDCVVEETVGIETTMEQGVTCGPRAYLRPGTYLCEHAKAGTHVEIKNPLLDQVLRFLIYRISEMRRLAVMSTLARAASLATMTAKRNGLLLLAIIASWAAMS